MYVLVVFSSYKQASAIGFSYQHCLIEEPKKEKVDFDDKKRWKGQIEEEAFISKRKTG